MNAAGTSASGRGRNHGPPRRSPAHVFALLAAATVVLASGCGTRWNDSQRAAVAARNRGLAVSAGSDDASGTDPGTGTATTIAGGRIDTSGASPGSPTGGPVGGGPTVTVKGGGTGPAATTPGNNPQSTGPKPCAAPSNAPGLTDSTITIGNVSSVSGPVPGLGTSSVAGARAYVAYRNATGGVCGRRLELKTADDGADNGQFRSLTSQIAQKAIGFMGQLGGGDAGGADVVTAGKIPVVTTAISEQFQDAATVFDMNPPFADVHAVIGKYKYLYDHGVRKASLVFAAVDQTRSEMLDKQKPQMEAAGIQVVNIQELPLSTLSFDSAARGVANSGADYLLFLSAGSQNSSMARSMHDTGYKLKFSEILTAYGTNFIDLAGASAEGTTSWIRTLPNEDNGSVPEQAAFLQWMAQTSPDTPADTFAADAWASSKAFVDSLEALPGPITRDALLAQLHSLTAFDAGGFEGRINLGGKRNNGCFISMIVQGGKWVRLTPDKGFLC